MNGWVTSAIVDHGYLAVFLLMVVESACIPVPSEVTMLFGGALANATFVASVAHGHDPLNVVAVGVAGTLGNLVGSWIAWGVGYRGGRPMIERYGRYIFLKSHHVDRAEAWFARRGELTVLLARVVPFVRTFVSLPAGVARMPFGRFTAYTITGCFVWCMALAGVGYALGDQWHSIENNLRPIGLVIGAVAVGLIAYWVLRQARQRRGTPVEAESESQ